MTRSHLRGALPVAVALACLLPSTAAAAKSPVKVLTSILDAARAERSVHYESNVDYGSYQVTFVTDAGPDRGIQQITYRKAGKTGHVTVIVSANTAYLRGDAFTLSNYFGFNASAAANYAERWVRFPHADKGYEVVAAGVTLSSTVDELLVAGSLVRVPNTKIDGQSVLGVKGTAPASGQTVVNTVYAQAKGSLLPVEQIATRAKIHLTTTFSKWNEGIDVIAPKASTAISLVRKAGSVPVI